MKSNFLTSLFYYIGYSTNPTIRKKASSGGIGTAITRYLLSQPEFGTSLTFIFRENSAKTFRIAKNEQFTRVSPQ